MQSANPVPPAPALPFFAWVIPPGLEWWAVATRDPHPPVARNLLRALAAPQEGRA